jgi:hypothetical protein
MNRKSNQLLKPTPPGAIPSFFDDYNATTDSQARFRQRGLASSR